MKQFAVIGDPINQSLSPILHKNIFKQMKINASYKRLLIPPDKISLFVNDCNLDGYNITIPNKQVIIPLLSNLCEAAEIIGAVNCVKGSKGYNTDWVGFIKAVKNNKVDLYNKRCLILGAGGVARAVAYGLIKEKVQAIDVKNRTDKHADELLKWINSIYPNQKNKVDTPDIIINCTPLGMWPNIESTPDTMHHPGQVLIDTVYNPIETKWMSLGKASGAKAISGLEMFIYQGLASADIWFDYNISGKVDKKLIIKELNKKLCYQN